VRFWRGAARPVISQHIARTSSQHRHKGCRQARNRADRDNGCASPRPVDRLGEEHLRHTSKPVIADLCDIILLDRLLANYGPETKEARALLQRSVTVALEQFWPENGSQPANVDRRTSSVEALFDNVQRLSPQSDAQRFLQSQALTMVLDLGRTRVLLFEQLDSSIPVPFLIVLVFWLAIIFASFGLFAPRNATVVAAFFVCALSVSGALFLILQLDRSFEGLIQVSSAPLRAALAQLGQ
jgi:hypothetical protein